MHTEVSWPVNFLRSFVLTMLFLFHISGASSRSSSEHLLLQVALPVGYFVYLCRRHRYQGTPTGWFWNSPHDNASHMIVTININNDIFSMLTFGISSSRHTGCSLASLVLLMFSLTPTNICIDYYSCFSSLLCSSMWSDFCPLCFLFLF